MFTSSYRRDIVAVAEYSMNPSIAIFDTNLEHIHTFEGKLQSDLDVCELDVQDLYFDYSGQYLFVVTGCPSYDIRLCDLKEKQL